MIQGGIFLSKCPKNALSGVLEVQKIFFFFLIPTLATPLNLVYFAYLIYCAQYEWLIKTEDS